MKGTVLTECDRATLLPLPWESRRQVKNRSATISLLNYTKRGGEGGSCGAWSQPWPHPGLALSERRGSEGDPGIRQGRDGQDRRLGCRGSEGEAIGGGVGVRKRERGKGSNWGPAGELRWNRSGGGTMAE